MISPIAKIRCFILMQLLAFNISCQPNVAKKTLWTVAWSPNGKYIATGGNQDELKLFDAHTFELIKTYPVQGVQLSRIKWHPHKNKMAVISQSRTFKAKIFDLDTESWTELKDLKSSLRALDWNHNGELLAISELEGEVSVFHLDGTLLSRFMGDPKAVAGLDWHPYKNTMVTVGSQIGIYNHLGDTLRTFRPRKEEAFLLCVEWHKSGDFFAVGDYGDLENAENKLLQFWNIKGTKLNEIIGSIGEYRNIRWNPDGKKLASASDALRIWTKEGKLMAESKSTEDYLWGIDWSPNGKYIVTSSRKGKITIWDENANFVRALKY